MGRGVKLRFQLRSGRPSHAILTYFVRILGVGVSPLYHEARNHAMKEGAIIESRLCERNEILDMLRRQLRKELDFYFPKFRLDEGIWFHLRSSRRFLVIRGFNHAARPQCQQREDDQRKPVSHDFPLMSQPTILAPAWPPFARPLFYFALCRCHTGSRESEFPPRTSSRDRGLTPLSFGIEAGFQTYVDRSPEDPS